ncbi:hypothetical protein BKA02_000401 [Microbacterium pseudoresistens]|uniref:Uncharacterized protein n=1 Tax=Microbacterium pseudoresistens TaxID=640634 RepID=A0A7Y9JLV6_9MICO|nr:hypothetical protein [Microbacterium pseudoresistens]
MTEALVNTRVQEVLSLWGQNKTVATLARVLRA